MPKCARYGEKEEQGRQGKKPTHGNVAMVKIYVLGEGKRVAGRNSGQKGLVGRTFFVAKAVFPGDLL